MPAAGEYYDRLRRKVRSVTKNAVGEDVETFTDGALLWGVIEVSNGRRQKDYGAEQTGVSSTIRIRNMPTLSALDRLYAVEWDELWIIETIARGDNELVCECHRYDELTP